jgi:site-specific DNA-methyltransferase (adenine-specific)
MIFTLYQGDCLTIIPQLSTEFIAIITDPPYYRVVPTTWDQAWRTRDEWLAWLETVTSACKPLLNPHGSLLIFGDDENTAYMQVMLDKHLTLLNSLVWFKTNNLSVKSAANLRRFAPMTERILFYTPELCPSGSEDSSLNVNNFAGLRAYFKAYQAAIGLGLKAINQRLGHRKAEHAFYWNSTQWDLPTADTDAELGTVFYTNGFERRSYSDLWAEYTAQRRPFNATAETFDVISGPIVSQSENTDHPTTKPLWLMRHLVRTVTQPGDTVFDPMMGSGTTGVACMLEGRSFVGIEQDATYFVIAQKRIADAAAGLPMLTSAM